MTNSYTNIFGGAAVLPAQPSYLALSISANTTLVWPTESTEGANYVASQIDVTATAGSLLLAMPSGLLGSVGPACMVTNVGANSFTLTSGTGVAIATIAATQTWLITLTANTSASGSWRSIQVGATTGAATASGLADNLTTQANGSTLQVIETTRMLTGNDTITAADRGKLCVMPASGGGGTATVVLTSSLGVGWYADFMNLATLALFVQTSGGENINNITTAVSAQTGGSFRLVASAGSFNTTHGVLSLTSNAVVLGGGRSGTLTTVASMGTSGQVLTSNGLNAKPSFQTLAALAVPVTGNGCYNGGCRVGARADAALTVNLSTTATYGQVDLVRLWVSGAGATVGAGTLTRQSGNSFGSTGYSAQITGFTATGTAANATVNFGYRLEAKDAAVWIGQTAIFQIVVNQNTGSSQNYTITINKANVADDFSAVTQIAASGSIAVASGVATTISFSAALGSCGNGIEVIVSSICGAVTTKNFDFCDFGLFLGTAVISPFPEVPYNLDLMSSKRYLPRWSWTAVNINTHPAYSTSTTNAQVSLPYGVEPRIAPTGISVGAAAAYSLVDVPTGTRFDCTSVPTFVSSSQNTLMVQAAATTSLTTRSPIWFGSGSAGSAAYIIATGAEL